VCRYIQVRDAAENPAMHRTTPDNKELCINSAEFEKLYSITLDVPLFFNPNHDDE
jgi:hypothetical protein